MNIKAVLQRILLLSCLFGNSMVLQAQDNVAIKELVSRLDLESYKSVISGSLHQEIDLEKIDYVFLDGGHKYETVFSDLNILLKIINNNGTILCDDYDLTYAPGIKKAIDEFVKINKLSLRILKSRFAEITKSL